MSETRAGRVAHIALRPAEQLPALFVNGAASPRQIVDALALPTPHGLVILNGGTARLEPERERRLAQTLQEGLARVVAEERLTVITGGTDAGIFSLFGAGLGRWGRAAPCIGVSVAALVTWSGKPTGEAPLEPHHSHFVLVEGEHWGDETATMYALAAELGRRCSSVAIFAGGGEITIHEMQMSVVLGWPLVLLAGSGRATDQVLAARSGLSVDDPRLVEIARQGAIFPFDLNEPPAVLHALLRRLIGVSPP